MIVFDFLIFVVMEKSYWNGVCHLFLFYFVGFTLNKNENIVIKINSFDEHRHHFMIV